jgi:hypothetical protein
MLNDRVRTEVLWWEHRLELKVQFPPAGKWGVDFFKAVFILSGFFVGFSSSWAQDLSREDVPEFLFQSRHLSGIGPVLLSCLPSEKGALRCKADRKLKAVECELATQLSAGPLKNSLRGKVSGAQFLCERPAGETLGVLYKISLLSAEGGFSEYSVGFAAPDQVKALYQQEMKYFSQRKARLERVDVSLNYFLVSGAASSTLRGLGVQGEWLEGLWAHVSFLQAASKAQAFGQDWRMGLRWEISPRSERWVPYVGFAAGQLAREGKTYGLAQVSAGIRADLLGRWLTTESTLHFLYPNVSRMRNAYQAVQEIQFGPFFSRRLTVSARASWVSEVWTGASGVVSSEWSQNSISYGAGLTLSFGERR